MTPQAAPLVQSRPSRAVELLDITAVPTGTGAYVHEADVRGVFTGTSIATADYECTHGRLPRDVCPSPAVRTSKGQVVQNWPHAAPCACWGGV